MLIIATLSIVFICYIFYKMGYIDGYEAAKDKKEKEIEKMKEFQREQNAIVDRYREKLYWALWREKVEK